MRVCMRVCMRESEREHDPDHVPLFSLCLCVFLIWAHMSLSLHNPQTGFWSQFFKMRHLTHTSVHLWLKVILAVEAYPNMSSCVLTSHTVQSVGSANINM